MGSGAASEPGEAADTAGADTAGHDSDLGDAGPVPAWIRRVAYGLVGLVLVFGLARIEAFPLSGFRLFSGVRDAERESWYLRAVDGAGDEEPLRLSELPVSHRNSTGVLDDFDDLREAERDEICAAWADPLRAEGHDIVVVRVYRARQSVWPDAPPAERELMWECGHR